MKAYIYATSVDTVQSSRKQVIKLGSKLKKKPDGHNPAFANLVAILCGRRTLAAIVAV